MIAMMRRWSARGRAARPILSGCLTISTRSTLKFLQARGDQPYLRAATKLRSRNFYTIFCHVAPATADGQDCVSKRHYDDAASSWKKSLPMQHRRKTYFTDAISSWKESLPMQHRRVTYFTNAISNWKKGLPTQHRRKTYFTNAISN